MKKKKIEILKKNDDEHLKNSKLREPQSKVIKIEGLIPRNHKAKLKVEQPTYASNKSDTLFPVLPSDQKIEPPTSFSTLSSTDFPALGSSASTPINSKSSGKVGKSQQSVAEKSLKSSITQIKTKNNQERKISEIETKIPKKKSEDHKINSATCTVSPCIKTSVEDFFKPKIRESGAEHDLLRLYEEGKIFVQNNGRQRLRPRRKKFTSLKKKVLEERLRKWKESQPTAQNSSISELSSTVCIKGFCEREELEDDDEYEEIVENLQDMANKVGNTKSVFILRNDEDSSKRNSNISSFVQFSNTDDAVVSVKCWNGFILGGHELQCYVLPKMILRQSTTIDTDIACYDDLEWRDWCLKVDEFYGQNYDSLVDLSMHEVYLHDALNDDDLADEDCREESVVDFTKIASKFGEIENTRVDGSSLVLTYKGGIIEAQNASKELNNMVVGGVNIRASLGVSSNNGFADAKLLNDSTFVELRNILTDDDLTDEEGLQETLNDIRELGQKYGTVLEVTISNEGNCENADRFIRIHYSSLDEAATGVAGFDGIVIGGQEVSASLPNNLVTKVFDRAQDTLKKNITPMFSGNKVISERFAECKQVPKIPNSGEPRKYATLMNDDIVKTFLVEMLSELMRLQQRAIEDKNAKARRRIVMGLREVARGIRSHKVKLVVMANNLDDYGVIDDKLQDIINLAHNEEIPIFYELSKRGLGKALGKSIKIAVAGIQNADGAHEPFKKLVKLASLVLTQSTDKV